MRVRAGASVSEIIGQVRSEILGSGNSARNGSENPETGKTIDSTQSGTKTVAAGSEAASALKKAFSTDESDDAAIFSRGAKRLAAADSSVSADSLNLPDSVDATLLAAIDTTKTGSYWRDWARVQEAFAKGDSVWASTMRDSLHRHLRDSLTKIGRRSLRRLRDTAALKFLDSMYVVDSIARPKSSINVPVFSTARDSTIEVFEDGHNMIYYYGDVSVKYGDMEIKADYMQYDVQTQTVYASGVADSSGLISGKPVMSQGQKTYDMDNVFYNFRTQKAKVRNMITKEQDGAMHGYNIKMDPDKSFSITGGKYTLCDLDHPHYYLKMTRAKVETQPKQKTVFGPAYLVLGDVPLPLALPFGFVPRRPLRASGILFPTFGEEEARGLFFKDGGFYFTFGDYLDLAVTASIFTKGSWGLRVNSRYKWRYHFDGNFTITYSHDQTGEKGTPEYFETSNFGVSWSHAMDSKARPGLTFRASVNFSSPSNNKYNSTDVQQALQNQISSSISLSRTWSKMSLSINALHSQNMRDSSYAITLPNVTFNLNKIYPFKKKVRSGKEKWYEQFSIGYNTTFVNKVNFKVKDFETKSLLDMLQSGMSHKFSIGLPTFTILKYINFSPSVNYGMNWFFQSQEKYYNPETDKLEVKKTPQFGTFGITQDFSASLSMSTRIYGTFNFRGKGKLRALRHMITPSLGANYRPEMGTEINGFRVYNYTDIRGVDHREEYNIYQGGVNSVPSKGQTAGLSFSLGNNLEAKVVDKKDTTGTGTKKVKIIDNLGISGSYNFLADSCRLSNINISASTNILEKLGLSGNMSFDPYAVDYRGQRCRHFAVSQGQGLLRLTNASISASFSISGDGKGKGNDGQDSKGDTGKGGKGAKGGKGGGVGGVHVGTEVDYMKVFYHPVTGEYIPGGWVYYLNPEVPWSCSFNLNYSYNRSYQYSNEQLLVKNNHTATIGIQASLRLTKALNVNLNTGFDVIKGKLTTTQISATYDLHCFMISFSWVPSGQWSQWNFRIAAKAAALADLLQYKKNSSYWDRQ